MENEIPTADSRLSIDFSNKIGICHDIKRSNQHTDYGRDGQLSDQAGDGAVVIWVYLFCVACFINFTFRGIPSERPKCHNEHFSCRKGFSDRAYPEMNGQNYKKIYSSW